MQRARNRETRVEREGISQVRDGFDLMIELLVSGVLADRQQPNRTASLDRVSTSHRGSAPSAAHGERRGRSKACAAYEPPALDI